MRRFVAILLCISLTLNTTLAGAADVVMRNIPQGETYWKMVVTGDRVTATTLNVVTIGTPPTTPTESPTTPTDPVPGDPPSPTTPFGRNVAKAADAASGDAHRGATAYSMGVIYNDVGKRLKNGEIVSVDDAFAVVRAATNRLLEGNSAASSWDRVRSVIGEEFTARLQDGALDHNAFREVAEGLHYASRGSTEAINILAIIAIVKTSIDAIRELRKIKEQRRTR